jgi:hypothetical protein
MGLETAFLGLVADPGKRKFREVEGRPLTAAAHRQHCFRHGDWRSGGRPCCRPRRDPDQGWFERIAGGAESRASGEEVDHRPCGAGGATDAYVCRLLSLTCFAPDIVEAILDGRRPKGLRLADLLGNGPFAWHAQRGFSN